MHRARHKEEKVRTTALLCAAVLLAPTAIAWNDTGHRAIAFLAYSHLKPKARARVAAILRAHPDFAAILSRGNSKASYDVDRNAFVAASTWPDIIRSDKRFGPKANPVSGFPDMDRHTAWHFINTPIPAEFASLPIESENAVSAVPRLLRALRTSGPVSVEEAYALPWILHIVTDLHQPLHTVARFSNVKGKPEHDRGGNTCFVTGASNLHSLWDGLLGRDDSEGAVARLAASLGDEHPQPRNINRDPRTWVKEGVGASATHVYSFTGSCADKNAPAQLDSAYMNKAASFARSQAATAAYRLAAILNKTLDR